MTIGRLSGQRSSGARATEQRLAERRAACGARLKLDVRTHHQRTLVQKMTDATSPIALGDVSRVLDQDPFWAVRAKAIQSYASLEQSLCGLLASLGNIEPEVAGIIFFKISSTDSRNKILEKLFKRRHQGQYNLFINSLISQLRPIDLKRNEIVHWNTAQTISGPAPSDWSLSLIPPNFWTHGENSPSIGIDDLVTFANKCSFYTRLINMLSLVLDPRHQESVASIRDTWLKIFAQPITYPPQATHPLSQNS